MSGLRVTATSPSSANSHHISRNLRPRSSKTSARDKVVNSRRIILVDEEEVADNAIKEDEKDQKDSSQGITTRTSRQSSSDKKVEAFAHRIQNIKATTITANPLPPPPDTPSKSNCLSSSSSSKLSFPQEQTSMTTTSTTPILRPHSQYLRDPPYDVVGSGHRPRRAPLPNLTTHSNTPGSSSSYQPRPADRASASPLSSVPTSSVSSAAPSHSSSASPLRPPLASPSTYRRRGHHPSLEQGQHQQSARQGYSPHNHQVDQAKDKERRQLSMEGGGSPDPETEEIAAARDRRAAAMTRSESHGGGSGASGSRGSGPLQSPSFKRTHSEISVGSESGESGTEVSPSRLYTDDPRAEGIRKQAKYDAGEDDERISLSPGHASAADRLEQYREPREARSGTQQGIGGAERNYVWQSSSAQQQQQPGSLMSITTLSSPTSHFGKAESGGSGRGSQHQTQAPILPSPGQMGRSSRMMTSIESRLPGIASLSQRPTSPPPQVSKINASRSFVAAAPPGSAASGMTVGSPTSNTGRTLSHFTPGHSHHLSLQVNTAVGGSGRVSGHQSFSSLGQGLSPTQAGLSSPIFSLSSANASCPPIHPSLAGLPGSGTGPGNKQQPSFVAKLYSMLEDETTSNMISWSPSGDVFSVSNPAEFSRVVLPTWFKHANWQSFVRQLNMYGFHKVNHTFSGLPNEEVQIWEFKHSYFRRGEVHLLSEIKRKSSRHKRGGSHSQSFSGSIAGMEFSEGSGGGAVGGGGRTRSESETPLDYDAPPGGGAAMTAGPSGSSMGLNPSSTGSSTSQIHHYYSGGPPASAGGVVGPHPRFARPGVPAGAAGGWESVDAADHPPPKALLSASRVTSIPARYRSLTDADKRTLQAERALEQVMREGEAMRGEPLGAGVPMDRSLGGGSSGPSTSVSGGGASTSRFAFTGPHRKSASLQGGPPPPGFSSTAPRLQLDPPSGGKRWGRGPEEDLDAAMYGHGHGAPIVADRVATSSSSAAAGAVAVAPPGPQLPRSSADGFLAGRLEDLSDRIDSIIRHSDYLEGQVRTLSQELTQAHEREEAGRRWTLRILQRLFGLAESSGAGNVEKGAAGGGDENRSRLLDACRGELAHLSELARFEAASASASASAAFSGSPIEYTPRGVPVSGEFGIATGFPSGGAAGGMVTPTSRRHLTTTTTSTIGSSGPLAPPPPPPPSTSTSLFSHQGGAGAGAGSFYSNTPPSRPGVAGSSGGPLSSYSPRNPNLPASSPMVRSTGNVALGSAPGPGPGSTSASGGVGAVGAAAGTSGIESQVRSPPPPPNHPPSGHQQESHPSSSSSTTHLTPAGLTGPTGPSVAGRRTGSSAPASGHPPQPSSSSSALLPSSTRAGGGGGGNEGAGTGAGAGPHRARSGSTPEPSSSISRPPAAGGAGRAGSAGGAGGAGGAGSGSGSGSGSGGPSTWTFPVRR